MKQNTETASRVTETPASATPAGVEKATKIYDYIGDYYQSRAGVQKDGKWGFIDYEGKLILKY